MLNLPNNGYRIFQVSLYNEEVRRAERHHQPHCFYSQEWAHQQVRDVVARDEDEALELIMQRFPPEDGFVVEQVRPGAF